MDEFIKSNTLGYIKIDKMTISNIEILKEDYLKKKEKIIKEILEILNEKGTIKTKSSKSEE
tara:strand:- start:1837 stop:2019 length:183 start_codon:yes stop_codon:yes gene_type:complete